jgi:hypothetical protein
VKLPIVGESVTRVDVGYQVSLILDSQAAIQVEAPIELTNPAAVVETGSRLGSEGLLLLDLFETTIVFAEVVDRDLRVGFSNGQEMVVRSRPFGEAWNLSRRGSPSLIVSRADGDLAIWD